MSYNGQLCYISQNIQWLKSEYKCLIPPFVEGNKFKLVFLAVGKEIKKNSAWGRNEGKEGLVSRGKGGENMPGKPSKFYWGWAGGRDKFKISGTKYIL